MNDYIQRVAEAVRDAAVDKATYEEADRILDEIACLDLNYIIASVTLDAPSGLSGDEIRAEFETTCRNSKTTNFPLNAMTINGKFHHYMDSDTDSAWLGYRAGVRYAERAIEQRSARQGREPVGVVDEGDDGLFVDLEMPNGVMVKRGDKLYVAQPLAVPDGWQKVIHEVVSNIGEQCEAINDQKIVNYISTQLDRLVSLLTAAPRQEDQA